MERFHQQGLFDGGVFGMRCNEDTKRMTNERVKQKLRSLNPRYECYEWYAYLRELLAHKIQLASAKVDDADPLVPTTFSLSYNTFNRRLANYIRIERDNALLLKKIQQIFARKNYPNTKLLPTSIGIHSKAIQREREIFQIMFKNIIYYKRLKNIKPLISRKLQLKAYEKHLAYLRRISNFPLWRESRVCAPHEIVARKRAERFPRDRVFMDIEVEDKMSFRIVIELFSDITPMAAENFRCLCMGVRQESFKCVRFDKVIPGILWRAQTQKVNSIFGFPFPPENFKVKHDQEGLISMPTFGKRGLRSEFLITLRPLQCLDGENVVVGKIIFGYEYMKKATAKSKPIKARFGSPYYPIMIMKSGEISDMTKAMTTKPVLFKEILEQVIRAKLADEGHEVDFSNFTGEGGYDVEKEDLEDFTPTSSYSGDL